MAFRKDAVFHIGFNRIGQPKSSPADRKTAAEKVATGSENQEMKKLDALAPSIFSTEPRSRTGTPLRAMDFESIASAYSASPASTNIKRRLARRRIS